MSFNQIQKKRAGQMKRHMKKGGYFVGNRIVQAFTVQEDMNLVGILYEDNAEETVTVRQWEGMRSEMPYQNNLVSQRRYEGVVKRMAEIAFEKGNGEDAIRDIMDLLMEERSDLGTTEWLMNQLADYFRAISREVTQRLNDAYVRAVGQTFDVMTPDKIMLEQLHDILTDGKYTEDKEKTPAVPELTPEELEAAGDEEEIEEGVDEETKPEPTDAPAEGDGEKKEE